jgi:hypothetical protein
LARKGFKTGSYEERLAQLQADQASAREQGPAYVDKALERAGYRRTKLGVVDVSKNVPTKSFKWRKRGGARAVVAQTGTVLGAPREFQYESLQRELTERDNESALLRNRLSKDRYRLSEKQRNDILDALKRNKARREVVREDIHSIETAVKEVAEQRSVIDDPVLREKYDRERMAAVVEGLRLRKIAGDQENVRRQARNLRAQFVQENVSRMTEGELERYMRAASGPVSGKIRVPSSMGGTKRVVSVISGDQGTRLLKSIGVGSVEKSGKRGRKVVLSSVGVGGLGKVGKGGDVSGIVEDKESRFFYTTPKEMVEQRKALIAQKKEKDVERVARRKEEVARRKEEVARKEEMKAMRIEKKVLQSKIAPVMKETERLREQNVEIVDITKEGKKK